MKLDDVRSYPGKERSLGWSVARLATLQQKFEASIVGEVVISGLVALILMIGVVWNMPDAAIKRKLMPLLTPIAVASGLDQGWSMFAPEPPHHRQYLEVHVTMADGGERIWTFQRGDPVIGVFSWYRWQKLTGDSVVRSPASRPAFAHWVTRELSGPTGEAVRVRIISRTELLPAPGTNGPRDTHEETLYDENLTPRP